MIGFLQECFLKCADHGLCTMLVKCLRCFIIRQSLTHHVKHGLHALLKKPSRGLAQIDGRGVSGRSPIPKPPLCISISLFPSLLLIKASADDAAVLSPLPPQAWVLWLMAWSLYKTLLWFKRPLWFNHSHSKQCISGWQLSGKGSVPFKFHWFRMCFVSNKLACKQTSPALDNFAFDHK